MNDQTTAARLADGLDVLAYTHELPSGPMETISSAADELRRLDARERELVAALQAIERWDAFPSTGRFWDAEGTRPMSYSAAFGSNGERDYMRSVARAALANGGA